MNKVWMVWYSYLGETHNIAGIFSNEILANKCRDELRESADYTAFTEEWDVDAGH